jgi:hypothetical protein
MNMTAREALDKISKLREEVYVSDEYGGIYDRMSHGQQQRIDALDMAISALEAQEPRVLKCEKCGREISEVHVNYFDHNGSDSFQQMPLVAHENGAYIDADRDWTGYELSEEERPETIVCPYCGEFPFNSTEIQVYDIVRLVCFSKPTVEQMAAEKWL